MVKLDGIPGEVLPDIFIGGVGAAFNEPVLSDIGITHILTCAKGVEPKYPKYFKYELLDCYDSNDQNITELVEQANTFLREAVRVNIPG